MVIAFLGLSDTNEGVAIAGAFAIVGSFVTLVVSQFFTRRTANDERQSRLAERQAEISARQEEQQADRKEWYRHLLFERRVLAVTEAYKWARKIIGLVNHTITSKPRDEALLTELHETVNAAEAWFDSNAIYLYDALSTPSNFTGMINSAHYFVRGGDFDFPGFNALWKELRERTEELLEPMREGKDRV